MEQAKPSEHIGGPGEDFTEDALERERQQEIYDQIKKEEKLQQMRLTRSNNMPGQMPPDSPKFQDPNYSIPKQLPTTKKNEMTPESYLSQNNQNLNQFNAEQNSAPQQDYPNLEYVENPDYNSKFGGRVNDAYNPNDRSISTIRRPEQQDPDKSITVNDDLQALAQMLAKNVGERREEQAMKAENEHLSFIAT